ncbi:MAG TPA: hypothetical protein VNK05_12330 [Chloroflexota bacterium]|nr:hypothetical protein [Chloroflexota bacterium]
MCLGCLFAIFAVTFPRVAVVIMWVFTDWIALAFRGEWLWPLLGLVFLPFTTMMYVFVSLPVGGISFGGWLMVGLGVLVDLSHWGQLLANRRNGVQLYNQYAPTAARS